MMRRLLYGFLLMLLCGSVIPHCSRGQFACDEDTCIPEKFVCDKSFDCPTGNDEAGCLTFKEADYDAEGIELRSSFNHGFEVSEPRPISRNNINKLNAVPPSPKSEAASSGA